MSSSQARRFGSIALAFVFGAALSAAITFVAMRASTIETPVVSNASDSPTDLAGELHEIRASLAEIRRELALRDASPSERAAAPSPPDLERFERTLAAHDVAIEGLRAGSGVSKASERGLSLAERKQSSSGPRWDVLDAWLAVARDHQDAASALVQLLTYDEVLVRYGVPTSVRPATSGGSDVSSNVSMWWLYARGEPDGDGQPEVRVHFGFTDDRVVQSKYFERDD